ncbi:peptidoglycan DD-metalloendopeptidase family protein [Hazenella coriacea]|uniref:Murein DD-endopeptidase MepM/ murein hydrolase activator NlpD n=1 Tax=Hazenella coriacea TaxID=1179467 RepID=A0A4R3L7Z7_9BACL|nr:peptidoglycan DD-metalloendopeptidase family protein [Hazenella coriacea]TCS95672.1 murein DD-endopeptidase MepM/ murein hydrolase activator NlpD [Hazenella coriacea]
MVKRNILTFALATSLVVTMLPIQGAHAEDARDKIKKVREEKKSVLDEISKTNSEMNEQLKVMKEADLKIKEIEKEVEPITIQLKQKEDEAAEVEKVFNEQMKRLYEQGETNYMAQLLSAPSFNEFLNRFDSIRLMAKRDYTIVEQRLVAVEAVKKEKAKYDVLIKKQSEQVEIAQEAYKKLQAKLTEKNKDLNKIEEFEELHEEEIIQINLKEWHSGKLRFPFPGVLQRPSKATMTSDYGYRYHPIFKTKKMHAGIDYAGPTGTPIYASANGVVVSSKASSGYGWLITIYHGDRNGKRVFTRYAHSFPHQVKVRVGQEVKAGEQITSIGNNGYSTGPHLHFELRYGHGDNPPSADPKMFLR